MAWGVRRHHGGRGAVSGGQGRGGSREVARGGGGEVVPPRGGALGAGGGLGYAWFWVPAVAVAIRVAHVLMTGEVPFVRRLVGDAAGYYAWAESIASGAWFGDAPFYQAPLYPYVLAVCFGVFGRGILAVRLVQAVWGAVGVACVMWGSARVFGRRTGVLAGVMLAAYGPAVFFDGIVQKASLACVLVCALVAAVGRAAARPRHGAWLVLGVVSGLVVLVRENAMVWLPVLGAWVWLRHCSRRDVTGLVDAQDSGAGGSGSTVSAGTSGGCRAARGAARRATSGTPGASVRAGRGGGDGWLGGPVGAVAVYLAGVCVVLAPVGVRNAVVGGVWSVSTFQLGPNFYIGNHRGADGRYAPLVRGHETPAFEQADAARLAEAAVGRSLSAREVSGYWLRRGVAEVWAAPGDWARLLVRKMDMVWNRYEVSDVESPVVYRAYSWVLRLVGVWHFGVLCPLAVLGVVVTWSWRGRLWVFYALIVSMACAVAVFYVLARYRFPLVPLLIPFAAVGCVRCWGLVRAGAWRRLVWPFVAACVVAVVVNRRVHDERRLDALAQMNAGVALGQLGDMEMALRFLRRAVVMHPTSAEAEFNLGYGLSQVGDYRGAIERYRRAQALWPGLPGVDYLMGVAYDGLGRREDALRHYGRAVEVDPADEAARDAVRRLSGDGG
ncbi:MAG: glycosyltransferase family 39 protein [Phycisphaerae bacterium]